MGNFWTAGQTPNQKRDLETAPHRLMAGQLSFQGVEFPRKPGALYRVGGNNSIQLQQMQRGGLSADGPPLEEGGVDAFELVVDLLAELLEGDGVDLDLAQVLLDGGEGLHGGLDLFGEAALVVDHVLGDELELVHLVDVLHGDLLLLLALLLLDLLLLLLLLALDLLLLLLLEHQDALVEQGQQVAQLGVDLVDQVAEVGAGLVVDALEEQHRREVLLEVLQPVPGHLRLQDGQDLLLLAPLDLLRQLDHLVLDGDDPGYVPPHVLHLYRVDLHDLRADELDLVVGAGRDLVDEVADGQLGALRQDVLDVPALDELQVLDGGDDVALVLARLEAGRVVGPRLPEQQDALLEHEEVHEEALLLGEEEAVLVLELDHLADLLVVVLDGVVAGRPVDDHAHPLLDVLEGLEALVQVADELRQLLGPRLADVALVDDQHQLHLLVDVQQSLHEEAVGYLPLLPLVVLEPRAVVEGQVLDLHPRRHRRLGCLLVADLDLAGPGVVEGGLEALVAHLHLGPAEVAHDGALADPGVPDHKDCLGGLVVVGDGLEAVVDHLLELAEVDGVGVALNA